MAKSRTQNAILNSLYGIASALTMIILNFAVRYFLVKSLGDEYYGLHSFFRALRIFSLCSSWGLVVQ